MKKLTPVFILLGIIILLILFRKPIKTEVMKLTRGYKNKNPGNIRKTLTFWTGEVEGTDKDFKTFSSMSYGYRAIFALLREYISKGYNTIEKIINRYAPSTENATDSYINTVVKKTGIGKTDFLTFADTDKMKKIVSAISFVENGIPANPNEINEGFKLV